MCAGQSAHHLCAPARWAAQAAAEAVQVIELVSGEGRSAEDFGFGEEDGSFFASTTPDTTPFDVPSNPAKGVEEVKANGDF